MTVDRPARALHIAVLIALAAPAAAASSPRVSSSANPAKAAAFQVAWARFREAVLAHDLTRVAALTAFPLTVHGESDDEVRRVGRAGFAAAFEKMLGQRPGGAGSPSNLARIRATPTLGDPGPGHVAVVGGLEFARTAAGPRLVRIFVDED